MAYTIENIRRINYNGWDCQVFDVYEDNIFQGRFTGPLDGNEYQLINCALTTIEENDQEDNDD